MKILKSTVVLCALFCAHLLFATDGWVELGNVSAVKELPQGLEFNAGRAHVRTGLMAATSGRATTSTCGAISSSASTQ